MKRVLFIHRWVGVHLGGTERHIQLQARFLVESGYEVHVLTRSGSGLGEYAWPGSIKVHRVPGLPGESEHSYEGWRAYAYALGFAGLAAFRALGLLLRGLRFDLVSVHFVTESVIALGLRWLTGTPFVFVLEGYTPLEGRMARLANRSAAISRDIILRCEREHGFCPAYVPATFDARRFGGQVDGTHVRRRYCCSDERLVLCVCRIEPRKRPGDLIDAALILRERGVRCKIVVVGEGIELAGTRRRAAAAGVTNDVVLVGRVPDEELPAYYAAADLFVLPTRYEGFGIVYLEAMAAGLPIVTTGGPDVGGGPEVLGEAGRYYPVGDVAALADAIVDLLGHPEEMRRLRALGKERLAAFAPERVRTPYLELVEAAVAERGWRR